MFTTKAQLERYGRARRVREFRSILLTFLQIAIITTVFYVLCELAYKLSGLI